VRDAGGLVVLDACADGEAEREPAAGERVDGRRLLRQQADWAQRADRHHRREADARGRRRGAGEHGEGVEAVVREAVEHPE
jgi:hypothetical protein